MVNLSVDEQQRGTDVVWEEGRVVACGDLWRWGLVDCESVCIDLKTEFEWEGKKGRRHEVW